MKDDLNDYMALVTVARERNFTRAAAQLGVSQSALSRTIRALEERMDLSLLVRTTRSVSLTDAGERLVATVAPLLSELHTQVASLRDTARGIAGNVRITATDIDARLYVWPRVRSLLQRYPKISIELINDYGLTDIVANRVDLGIRLGDQVARDMVAARIAPDLVMTIVGSPEYLRTHPLIQKPQDLLSHNCISLRLPTMNSLLPWELKKGRRQQQLHVSGQLIFNNVYQILEAALEGFGLAYLPEELVKEHIARDRLRWVLPEWFPVYTGLHVYYPSRRKPSRAVELVIDALKAGYNRESQQRDNPLNHHASLQK